MNNVKTSGEDTVTNLQFPVVGIGASAGGLEAVIRFLESVPEQSGMAYVFVQHLSPTHESALPEILEKHSKIPVHKITDDIQVEKDNLYIIPENKIVTAIDGALRLAPLDDKRHKIKVIDLFFSSLAVVHQSFAVGVVLSGTLDDGTLGLQVIKAYGGITFSQDEASAAFDGMPKNAISKGAVDFIMPPEKIAEHLLTINHFFPEDYTKKEVAATTPKKDDEIFKQLLTVLRVRRGVDFTYYKPATIKRRIVRRMALSMIEKPAEYLEYLRENKAEQDVLYNDMLISVTHFFRDPASFELLCNSVFPSIIKEKKGKESVRIWIAGCATGEEAYSMAICLQEQLGDMTAEMKIQIFATDISEKAIAKARSGIYKSTDMEGLSASRQQQFFTKLDGSYQVNKGIRDMCVFAHHNLLKDPPFSKMDLISCRNVMIYLEPVLQKRALTTFHYALNEGGFLMLGKSEGISLQKEMFAAYNNHEKIFRRKGSRGRFMPVATKGSEENFKDIDKRIDTEDVKKDVFKLADDIVLAKHAPAGFLVNEHLDIVQFRGKTDTWLEPSPGKASFNVLKMVRGGLAFELRNLLQQAKKINANARKENVLFKANGLDLYVNLDVTPINGAAETHYLILFENSAIAPVIEVPVNRSKKSKLKEIELLLLENEQLKKELIQSRNDMRSVTEEQEAVNEELQSANQELLSSSEELQSLNEELETSSEELQSTNEEITIVNNELVDRNEQLNNARAYTESIINTIRDPLVILDKDLKVKRATEGFYQSFKVTENETEDKYFYELGNNQWDIPSLRNLLERILPEKKILTDFEVTHVFPAIGRKVMLLNTRQLERVNGEQLILLAIQDITDKRKIEEGLAEVESLFKESKERLKLAVDAAGLGTWDYNPLNGELILDKRAKELLGIEPSERIDYQSFLGLVHSDDRSLLYKTLNQNSTQENGEFVIEFRTVPTQTNDQKWIRFAGKVYVDDKNVPFRTVWTSMDVTAQKNIDEAMKELLKKKDEFMSIASHELKTPITSLNATLQLLDRMKDNPSAKMLPNLIERANKSMVRLNVLIEDLLNVSKLNQGQVRLDRKRFIIAQMLEDCCGHVRAENKYAIKIEGDTELAVDADEYRIEQVIENFVNNAVKYAPSSKDIIVNISKEENSAKVSVTDKGPGINPKQIPYLFDRYYRVDSSGSQYSGLGLGLYISSEIIKKHDGKIGVDSVLGEGSTFWFTLPL